MTYKSKAFDRESDYLADKVAAHPSILNDVTYKYQGQNSENTGFSLPKWKKTLIYF